MWVGGCVTAPATWASPPGRRRRSVHRLAKMAPRCRFGAFVYTVAPLRTDVGTQKCTQIGGNSLSELFWGICVHCCAASCDASCDASCVGWHERPNRHGVPAAPPRWPPPLVGKTGPTRAVPPLAWRLRRGSNPHEPPKSHKVQAVPAPLAPQGADIGACGAQGYRKCSSTATKCITHLSCDYSGSLGRTGHSRCYLSLLRESLSRSLRPCSLPASLLRVRGSFMGAARTWRHIGSLGCQARGIDVVGALRHFGLDVMCHIPQ